MRHYSFRLFISLSVFVIILISAEGFILADEMILLDPNTEELKNWKTQEFSGATTYKVSNRDEVPAVVATSQASASALYRDIKIDLKRFPILKWSWKASRFPTVEYEQTKEGDDYAARVYVVVQDGWFPWQAKSINYVWSNQSPRLETWPNPYTDNVIMKAMDTGEISRNTWRTHQVNMAEDLERHFGKSFDHIDGIAIMTDSDNSGTNAMASYGRITVSDSFD